MHHIQLAGSQENTQVHREQLGRLVKLQVFQQLGNVLGIKQLPKLREPVRLVREQGSESMYSFGLAEGRTETTKTTKDLHGLGDHDRQLQPRNASSPHL
jgi:hypothetical protein